MARKPGYEGLKFKSDRVILITGARVYAKRKVKEYSARLVKVREIVDKAIKHKLEIVTGNSSGVEREVAKWCDKRRYKNLSVAIPVTMGGHMTVWGKNEITPWGQDQVDDVMVTRSKWCVFIGSCPRSNRMRRFAETIGKKVRAVK